MNAELKPTVSLARWRRPVLLAVLALGLLTPIVYSIVELVRFERADARRTTYIYAAGQSLAPGVHVQRIALAATLTRLGYTETRGAPTSPGQFRHIAGAWELFLRAPEGLGGNAQLVRLQVLDDRIVGITRDGQEVASGALE